MFEIDGKKYIIDIDRVFDVVLKSDKTERREQEITDGYDSSEGDTSLRQVSKMVREVKTKGDSSSDNVRYDFIRLLLMQILEEEGDESNLSLGTELAIDSLINYNVLKEIV
jgi:hypothetical protein